MRVCFLLPSLTPSGGTAVVVAHARRLLAGGEFEPELVITRPSAGVASDAGGVPVRRLADVAGGSYDIAVATWWETAAALYELRARRRCLFLQSIEHRFYSDHDLFERLGAEAVLGLPVHFMAVAGWMRDLLAELRPDARCDVVPNGIDKSVFRPRAARRADGPLRVLVEGQPSLWFKGVQDAVGAVRAMREPAHLTVACLDPREAAGLGADRVVGGLTPAEMAELYADSDVLVKLARVEGLGLAPLEAFHVGVPCVVTPYTGHAEYVRHGENGLVTGYDDEPGTAARLDLLAGDRALLERLGAGALATAAAWPDADESSRRLSAALTGVAEGPPPAEEALARLHRTLAFHAGAGRHRVGTGQWARAHADELMASRQECAAMLDAARAELAAITGTREYRAMAKARRLVARVKP